MHRHNRFLATAFCCLLAFTAFLAGPRHAWSQISAAQGTQTPMLPGFSGRLARHTAPQVLDGSAIRVGHYSPEKMLRLVLAVKPPHMAEEEQFLRDLQTKGSPNFHQFLTPEEWNARYAPSAEDEQKVVDWAESQGFTVTNRYNHRLIVDVEAPAGVIEKAFGVTINSYQFRDEVDFANDSDPILPANLSDILYNVQGLNNIQREHSSLPGPPPPKGPDYVPGPLVVQAGSGHGSENSEAAASNQAANDGTVSNLTGGFLDPSDIYSSQTYNYGGLQALSHCCNVHNDSGGSPKETSIAIAGWGNFLYSDIVGFMNAYGLNWNLTWYYIAGTPGCSKSTINPPCATGETTEDIEWSIATSNNPSSSNLTAREFVYLGGNFAASTYTTMYSQILSDNYTRILSTSWSCTEIYDCDKPTMDSRHAIFNNMVGVGFTLIAASGDRGAADDCQNNVPSKPAPQLDASAHTAVAYPASDYDFVAAGGTQIQLNNDGTWASEQAWQGGFGIGSCNGNGGGSGGGVSAYYSAPSWQNTLVSPYYSWVGSQQYYVTGNTMRLSPDISMNALGQGQNLFINGVMNGDANGTSVVAPELAGFFAQENTYLNYIGHICGDGTQSCVPVGTPNSFIYEDAINGAQHNPFYNMLSGCSSNDATQQDGLTYYCAGPGNSFDISSTGAQYNLVSGWGSANMMQLAWGINWQLIPAYGSPSIAFTGPPTSTWYNTNQTVSWTLSDSGGSLPAPGVAGFTQGWDSIPADPYSEPNGGSGNSFYSGPQYPFASTGCLAFSNNGCSGNGGAQGCHTVHVRGWDNEGVTTGDQTYGPLCYDTVAPTISISTSVPIPAGLWFNSTTGNPYVSLAAYDPGGSNASGVKTIYGVLGATSCSPTNLGTCQIYGPRFQILEGANPITAFSLDLAGNFSTVAYTTLYLDTVAPVTTDSLVGQWNNGTSTSAVQVNLNATDATSGVQYTYYTLDGGSTIWYSGPYGGPFMVSPAGSHTLKYWSVDYANNTETQNTATFKIKSPTTAAVVATPSPSMLGQSVTITATVTATLAGSGNPTGTVTFWNGATNLGTSALSGGVASITTSALPAGQLTLQASYNGATYFTASNSVPFDQTVNENTTTAVSISPNPLVFGQFVTVTATVTPATSGTPTGFVTIYLNGANVGNLLLSGGVGTASTPYFGSLTPGAYSITATYDGDSTYLTSSSTTLTLTVTKASQTITFPPITGTQYALTSVLLNATASSGLAVSFSTTTPTICAASGSTLSLLAAGTCVVHASQAGNADYIAAPTAGQSFAVSLVPQTITSFTPITGTQYALASVPLAATASSGLTVTFSTTTPTVCTASGSTLSLLIAGTCVVHASQAGSGVYAAAPMATQSFAVHLAPQTITFTPITGTQYALASPTLTATASSGLAVTLTSTTPTICTVSGSTASLLIAGTCVVQASQTGNSDYSAAPVVTQSFAVHLILQTISLQGLTQTPFALTLVNLPATATSGLPISFTSVTPTICTASGQTATLLTPGTCVVHATQAGNSDYAAAPTVAENFTVLKAQQTITFPAPAGTQYVLSSATLGATASSALAVSYTSLTPTVCSVSGSTASLLTTGTCIVRAAQAGNTLYSAASLVSQSFGVAINPQTISFAAITGTQYALGLVPLSATASSGLAVTFTSTTPTICTVAGAPATASLLIAGTCILHASQSGNSDYSAAPVVTQSFAVHLAPQTISFPAVGSQTVGANVTLAATATSGLTVTFSSTTTSVCTVSGSTASMVAAGTCVLHAAQAGNTVYASATTAQSFAVKAAI
jgi:ribosomal protein S11